jgi:hypothetical protein
MDCVDPYDELSWLDWIGDRLLDLYKTLSYLQLYTVILFLNKYIIFFRDPFCQRYAYMRFELHADRRNCKLNCHVVATEVSLTRLVTDT